jgi:hypothetical protein
MSSRLVALALIAASVACRTPRGPIPVLETTADRSDFIRTGRYAEAVHLCEDYARYHDGVACDVIGRTPQDRSIVALRIGKPDRPTLLIQAGIHAGEIEGKDAGFWFVRDLLAGKVAPGALDALHIVFVPVLNPDGHERFGPNHRPNQRGPEQMGFRANAVNLNLNRDYLKLDTPELRALVGVIRTYDPVLLVDLHTTDGAKFEHDIAVMVAPSTPRDDGLDRVAASLSKQVSERLAAQGHLPLEFYPAFRAEGDPASGFETGDPPPRFSHAYAAARGRLGVLVETHSWRTYKERATSTYRTLVAVTERAVADAARWRAAADAADANAAKLGGTQVTLLYRTDEQHREIEFHGFAYARVPSEISGATWTRYDETKPQIWKVPLHDHHVPALEVTAPKGGYIIDGGFARTVGDVLSAHGIRTVSVTAGNDVAVEVFRATAVTFDPPSEGRTRAHLTGAWRPETRAPSSGALFVPIAQPNARLVLHLLEPTAPDSLAQWGFFNAVFEAKEYLEPYLAEEFARELLAKDPALAKAWQDALAADPALANSPERRLDWFYRRHPAWDDRRDLLPVYRTDVDLAAGVYDEL